MKFLVLGIVGKRGSGKDTMANYLKEKYGFSVLTYTEDVTSPILRERNVPVTRENLINLALELREKEGPEILTKMICKKIKPQGFWVISGIRLLEEVECFRGIFRENFKLVAIRCKAKLRYDRLVKRGTKGEGEMSFEEFLEIEKKPTETPITESMGFADFTLDNNGAMDDLYLQIESMIENMKII